jgi:predicted peptidase
MKKIRNHLLIFITLTLCSCAVVKQETQSPTNQTARSFELKSVKTIRADYLLFLPKGYDAKAAKHWPMILFLHGAGERGTNIWKAAVHGPPKIVKEKPDFPFIVVSPQCPDGQFWSNEVLLGLLDEVTTKYAVDESRIYLTGLSMGGYGTWALGAAHPEKFAAIAPICGGGEPIAVLLTSRDKTQALKTLPVWAFHGAKDTTVPVTESERMVAAMKKAGCQEVKLTVYPEANHDSWTETYNNPELYDWFLNHERKPAR